MSAPMTKRERVTAAIRGEDLDRVPLSFFGHDYAKENAPEILAPYLVELGRKYDWDLVKVNLRMSCFQEAWDCRYRFDPERGPQMLDHVVKSIEDLKTLEKRDATKGVLSEQVRVVKLLSESLDSSVPRVQTVFTPLSVAGFLAGGTVFTPGETAAIRAFMEEDPDALDQALSAISHTLADFARESVRAGADGIFMTTTSWASRYSLSEEEYERFARPYDLAVYEAAKEEGATLNVLHLCRDNIMFDSLSDYPVQVISYDCHALHNPDLGEAMERTDKALWGGISQRTTLVFGPEAAVAAEVRDAVAQTGGRRLIIGPGCSVPPQAHPAHLAAATEAVEALRREPE